MKKKIELLESDNFKEDLSREVLLALFMASALAGLCKSNDIEKLDGSIVVDKAASIAAGCYDRYTKLTMEGEGEGNEEAKS
jgi:hypothetical protein